MALPGWTYRKRIYIHPDDIDSGLTDFPLLLKLSDASGITSEDITDIFTELGSDANRFKIAVGTDADVECYVEIERWVHADSEAWLHVKIPSISASGTYIFFYYDSAHADNTAYVGDINSTPGETVWKEGGNQYFKLVNHLAHDPTGTIYSSNSSIGGAGDYSSNGSMIPGDLQDAQIGKGLHFDGVDDFLDCTSHTLFDQTDITIELWFNSDILPGPGNQEYLFIGYAAAISAYLKIDDDQLEFWFYSSGGVAAYDHTTILLPSTWYYAAIRFDVNQPLAIWLNDDKETTGTPTANTGRGTNDWDLAGYNGSDCFDGLIDEIRVTTEIYRNDAWIKATYHSHNDNLIEWNADVLAVFSDSFEMTGLVDSYKPDDFIQENFTMSDSIDASGDSVAIEEVFLMDDQISVIREMQEQIVDSFSMDDEIDAAKMSDLIQENFVMNDEITCGLFYDDNPVFGNFTMSDFVDAVNWAEWLRSNRHKATVKFIFTLTGTPDGKSDVAIKISTVQATKRTGNPTYMSVVTPDFVNAAALINDRPNGEMVLDLVYFLQGVEAIREEFLRTTLNEIRPDEGARNRSITLTGRATETYQNQTVTLLNSTYRTMIGGRITHRFAEIDPFLNPGDTAKVGTDEFRIDSINYFITHTSRTMEIRGV